MEELRKEVGGREFQEEAAEELVKVGWTCGKNGNQMCLHWRVEGEEEDWLRWEDCMKRDLAAVGGHWRSKASDGRVEMGRGDASENHQ